MYNFCHRPLQIPVYNLTVDDAKKRTWKWIMDVGRDLGIKYPFEVGLWYPDGNMTSSKFYHTICTIPFIGNERLCSLNLMLSLHLMNNRRSFGCVYT